MDPMSQTLTSSLPLVMQVSYRKANLAAFRRPILGPVSDDPCSQQLSAATRPL